MPSALTEAARKPIPADEMAVRGEDDLGDMANLREDHTGVAGVIFISTRMGAHGPRVKWYEGRPDRAAPSFSVSVVETPEVVASSVEPRLLQRHSAAVVAWVSLNRDVLIEFWDRGAGLFEDERDALLARLRAL